jgi:ABC-2 type transport system permease protein
MSLLLHILRYKFLSFFKTTFDLRAVSLVRGIGSLIVFGGFGLVAYSASYELTLFVMEKTRIGLFLYHRFISMVLFVFFMAVNMGNIIVSYATLYRSAEVNFLFTKPVSFTQIFLLKFLDNFLYSSTTLFLVAFMVLFGYGTYFGYPWYSFLGILIFVLVPFMFLSASVAVLVLMSVMKVASRWGFRKVLVLIGSVYASLVFLFFRFTNPIRLVNQVSQYYPEVDQYFSQFDPGFLSYLPNNWVADFLFFFAKGQWEMALPFAGTLLAVTIGMFGLVLFVAHRFYYKSWLVTFEVQASSNSVEAGRKMKLFDFRKRSLLPPQVEAVLKKDYFQFFREPSQWIHLLLMLVLVIIFVLSIRNLNLGLRVTDVQVLTYLVLYAFGVFLSCSLALRFVFPSISLEGKSFWSQLSAPFDVRKLFLLKFAVSLLLVLTLAILVAVASNLPFVRLTERRPLLMYFGLYSAFWVSLTLVALNLGLGGYFSNFQEKNPIRLASSQGATLTFLVSLIYLVTLVVVVSAPLLKYFESLFFFLPFDFRMIVVPGTIFGMISSAIVGFSVMIGLRSLQRDF